MLLQGGERAFIERMIDESLRFKDQVHWFTSLVGCKANVAPLLAYLERARIPVTRSDVLKQVLSESTIETGLFLRRYSHTFDFFSGEVPPVGNCVEFRRGCSTGTSS